VSLRDRFTSRFKELVFEDDDYNNDRDLDEWQDELAPSLGSLKNEASFLNEVVLLLPTSTNRLRVKTLIFMNSRGC
jgi:hypothetical protein